MSERVTCQFQNSNLRDVREDLVQNLLSTDGECVRTCPDDRVLGKEVGGDLDVASCSLAYFDVNRCRGGLGDRGTSATSEEAGEVRILTGQSLEIGSQFDGTASGERDDLNPGLVGENLVLNDAGLLELQRVVAVTRSGDRVRTSHGDRGVVVEIGCRIRIGLDREGSSAAVDDHVPGSSEDGPDSRGRRIRTEHDRARAVERQHLDPADLGKGSVLEITLEVERERVAIGIGTSPDRRALKGRIGDEEEVGFRGASGNDVVTAAGEKVEGQDIVPVVRRVDRVARTGSDNRGDFGGATGQGGQFHGISVIDQGENLGSLNVGKTAIRET